jgi:hypothetical protein
MDKPKWNIDVKAIEDPNYLKWRGDYDGAQAQMKMRTQRHELYGLIAKNKSIHDMTGRVGGGRYFSEGSAQYILRKSLANTIQRMPDGELETQFDKASVEHISPARSRRPSSTPSRRSAPGSRRISMTMHASATTSRTGRTSSSTRTARTSAIRRLCGTAAT